MALHVHEHGSVRVLTIDRPERRNALDPDTMAQFGQSLLTFAADEGVRAVVITGAGDRAFCAGMDLKAFSEPSATGPRFVGPGLEVLTEQYYAKPVIAAVNGAAVGGGFGLMLACDSVVAADHATFAMPEVQRGLIGVGVSTRAARRMPATVALEMALTGDPIDAARAYSLGLVTRVVPGADVVPTALAIAQRIAANGPLGVRVTKEVIYDSAPFAGPIDMPTLRAKGAVVTGSEDAREGARAFLERRTPDFKGR